MGQVGSSYNVQVYNKNTAGSYVFTYPLIESVNNTQATLKIREIAIYNHSGSGTDPQGNYTYDLYSNPEQDFYIIHRI